MSECNWVSGSMRSKASVYYSLIALWLEIPSIMLILQCKNDIFSITTVTCPSSVSLRTFHVTANNKVHGYNNCNTLM